ncbi:IclR family transcriptional regulator [Sphingobium subterraneum]|uniref:DNA-binding IclR family transcriptional regulator n=1 Tax=Sphingobium subterraneum TaxID=627688 RepID=A0A841IYN0_9SPHN|nr:IclR family transcriptional regulator [Sphingobium subterraneum]MBB6123430.1 DNA-binding IclR family transcriptional regulator [Sphingobium subterraneum]
MGKTPSTIGKGLVREDLDEIEDNEDLHKNHEAYFVPGLHRGLLVMETIAAEQKPMSVTEIAKHLGLTRSSVFRLIYTLRHMGFLEASPDTKEFMLGPRVLNIGFAYLSSKDIIEISRSELERLRDDTGISTHLAIRDGREVLYLNCVQNRSGFLSNLNVGARLPAYATPMGWLLLSELSAKDIRKLYESVKFQKLSEQTPDTLEALLIRVGEAAARGYVISRGILEHGGSSVSAPVYSRSGDVVGAIDISGPDTAFDLSALDTRYVEAVVNAARQISRKLGYVDKAA